MITTLIFDLSEVYLQGMKGVDKYLQNNYNLPKVDKPLYIPELSELFHGRISEDAFWEAVLKKYPLHITKDELKKIVRQNFKEIEGTRTIIEELHEKKYKLGLLSVHAKEWVDHCEKEFDYHKLFNSVMYSFEVEVCKPDRKAFELIIESLQTNPKECLFIDDSEENIYAAKELGMNTILFISAQQLKEQLSKLKMI